jgi:hypothetical protein
VVAFREEMARPSSVRGPVEAPALAVLAASCADVDMADDPFVLLVFSSFS